MAAELLNPGQVFAQRYRVERFLAKGGMGAVFVAQQLATDQAVALKVLWPGILSSARALSQFELEAKVAGRVKSENIVRVLDAGHDTETGFPFLVMELLEGTTLEAVVEKQGPLGAAEAIEYLAQTARGLERAHAYTAQDGTPQPIVHRDLKPENLFRTQRDTGEPLIKILDFGIAKSLSESAQVSQEVRGTPLYMAYEQAAGEGITPQTDIWALGLIAFFLLTGRCFWKAASNPQAGIAALFAEILTDPKPLASERSLALTGKSLGPGFDAWLARCLARESSQRFGSASEAVQALRAALEPLAATVALPAVTAAPASAAAASAGVSTGVASTADKLAVARTGRHEKQSSGYALPLGVGALLLVGAGYGLLVAGREEAEPDTSTTRASASSGLAAPPVSAALPELAAPAAGNAPSWASAAPSAAPGPTASARRPPNPLPPQPSSKPARTSASKGSGGTPGSSDFTPDGFFRNP